MNIPHVTISNGKKILNVDGKPFVMLSGELHNSSSSSLAYMEPIWEKMDKLCLNSLLVPVTWQQVEPVEGEFHFELVDGLIEQAKQHNMKLGILWFGSWKNASCSYAPDWVKTEMERFPRAEAFKGNRAFNFEFHSFRMSFTTLSAFCEETAKADAKAFRALCQHIKEYDTDHTVILIQVENETGLLGAGRDHSDIADAAYRENVPQELIDGLMSRWDGLEPDLRESLEKCTTGTWEEVFGAAAEEVFMAWHTARHIEMVASSGKEVYPIPMYANCWLTQGGQPGQYPSGGPVYRMMEVYQTAAPSLDWFAPDIYIPEFVDTCNKYTKQGNPLFIPEIALHSGATARLIYAIGHHHAMCFAPFGIDDIGFETDSSLGAAVGMDANDENLKNILNPHIYTRANELLKGFMPVFTAYYGTENLQAVIQENPDENCLDFGDMQIQVTFGMPGITSATNGACMVCRANPNEYYLLGYGAIPFFISTDASRPNVEFLSVEEGEFVNGKWVMQRLLNGDEGIIRIDSPTLLKIRTHQFA